MRRSSKMVRMALGLNWGYIFLRHTVERWPSKMTRHLVFGFLCLGWPHLKQQPLSSSIFLGANEHALLFQLLFRFGPLPWGWTAAMTFGFSLRASLTLSWQSCCLTRLLTSMKSLFFISNRFSQSFWSRHVEMNLKTVMASFSNWPMSASNARDASLSRYVVKSSPSAFVAWKYSTCLKNIGYKL